MTLQLGNDVPLGRAAISDLSSAIGFTSPPATARKAVLQVFTQNVRLRDDGTNPTASTGLQLVPGNTYTYTGDMSAVRFIEETSSATMEIAYYGQPVTYWDGSVPS